MSEQETVLVIAAHPDDEVLGCGGTMARHAKTGDAVHVLFLADGEMARGEAARSCVATRREQAKTACKMLGAAEPLFETFLDNQMDSIPLLDVVRAVEHVIENIKPTVVYTHHSGDLNVDHRIAHQAVLTACRPISGNTVKAIHAFETVSSTEWAGPSSGDVFAPTYFVDISETLATKLDALAAYASEMRSFPHPRSREGVKALAKWRGASVGLQAAESFRTIRSILR